MGAVCQISRPEEWKVKSEVGKDELTGEPVLAVAIGMAAEGGELVVNMVESHFNKCSSRKWRVIPRPSAQVLLEIYNEMGSPVNAHGGKLY